MAFPVFAIILLKKTELVVLQQLYMQSCFYVRLSLYVLNYNISSSRCLGPVNDQKIPEYDQKIPEYDQKIPDYHDTNFLYTHLCNSISIIVAHSLDGIFKKLSIQESSEIL